MIGSIKGVFDKQNYPKVRAFRLLCPKPVKMVKRSGFYINRVASLNATFAVKNMSSMKSTFASPDIFYRLQPGQPTRPDDRFVIDAATF